MLELGLEAALVEQQGMRCTRLGIPDRGVPASPASALRLWDQLSARLRDGGAAGVHCRASIGRAGVIVAGTLVRLGVPEELAWPRVSEAHLGGEALYNAAVTPAASGQDARNRRRPDEIPSDDKMHCSAGYYALADGGT